MLETLKLVSYLWHISATIRYSRWAIALALLAGLLSGIGSTALLALISAVLAGTQPRSLLAEFIALVVAVSVARFVSQASFDWLGGKAIAELRLELSRRTLSSSLRNLEEIGAPKLVAALTEDVAAITNALVQVPRMIMNLTLVLVCLAYLGWLSGSLLLLILGFLAIGVTSFQLAILRARGYFRRLREATDSMFVQFRGLIHGAKELRLNRDRREAFLTTELIPVGEEVRRLTFVGNGIFTATAVWGNLLFFVAIGLLLFGPMGRGANREVLIGYTLALLYIMTPLEMILLSLPVLGRASAAIRKLDRLGLQLSSPGSDSTSVTVPPAAWKTLELQGITYQYQGDEGRGGFRIGPVDLTLRPGELVFLVGGNGSGKTTLAKILTGLYRPAEGEIRLDGVAVPEESLDDYRQLFSTVFSDFHLFEDLIDHDGVPVEEAAELHLDRLQLDQKVQIRNGKLSTLALSQGQRKRLALLSAYLEDRSIYFFDEWAADQDPQYRSLFYNEILPELKARGKAVVVISHDDQFYALADRLIKLSDGQVSRIQRKGNARPDETGSSEHRLSLT